MTEITFGELQGDYCVAELFKEQGNSSLNITYLFINNVEKEAFINNEVSVGMTNDNGDIIIYWEFAGGGIELITPFNAHLYTDKNRLNITQTEVVMDLVERSTNELIATRKITLPKSFMIEIVPAIEAQLENKKVTKCDPKWNNLDILDLKAFIKKFHRVL